MASDTSPALRGSIIFLGKVCCELNLERLIIVGWTAWVGDCEKEQPALHSHSTSPGGGWQRSWVGERQMSGEGKMPDHKNL